MKDIYSAKTITVRIQSDKEREILKEIVRETGCNQISKALMRTAEAFARTNRQNRQQLEEIKRLQRENEQYRRYAALVISAGKAMEIIDEKEK